MKTVHQTLSIAISTRWIKTVHQSPQYCHQHKMKTVHQTLSIAISTRWRQYTRPSVLPSAQDEDSTPDPQYSHQYKMKTLSIALRIASKARGFKNVAGWHQILWSFANPEADADLEFVLKRASGYSYSSEKARGIKNAVGWENADAAAELEFVLGISPKARGFENGARWHQRLSSLAKPEADTELEFFLKLASGYSYYKRRVGRGMKNVAGWERSLSSLEKLKICRTEIW